MQCSMPWNRHWRLASEAMLFKRMTLLAQLSMIAIRAGTSTQTSLPWRITSFDWRKCIQMSDFRKSRIGLADAARLLQVPISELKASLLEDKPLRGTEAPKVFYKTGHKGWVFLAGDVMDVAERLQRSSRASSAGSK